MSKPKYHILSKMPYYNTKVPSERTKLEIITLLEKYDIQDHQWTKLKGKENLKFIMDVMVKETKISQAILFEIPSLKAIKGQKKELVDVPHRQMYRMFYYALKSLLESTKYGILSKQDVFLPYMLTQLPSGEYVQMKEVLKDHPQLLLPGGIS